MKSEKPSSRLLTFDLLRGYFLLSIILNHLYWYPSGLDIVAARGDLFVTAAEGFFLISGIILGIVRGHRLIDQPFKKAAILLIKRGIHLYATSIILMLIFTLIGWFFFLDNPGLKPGIRPVTESFLSVLGGALTFNYIYGWADYLRLYSIFLLASPIALWLLRKRKWYILTGLSVVIWLLFPASGTSPISNELLMPIAWQLIFFGGFTIGFYWPKLTAWWQDLSEHVQKNVMGTIASVAIITIVANIILFFGKNLPGGTGEVLTHAYNATLPFFTKESLPLPRILLFATWFSFGFWFFHRYEHLIVRWFGWILIPFGNNSLYVYIIHAFVLFFAHLIMWQASSNILLNLAGSLVIVGLIWLSVRHKFLMNIIPR